MLAGNAAVFFVYTEHDANVPLLRTEATDSDLSIALLNEMI
jgi:hypothetical protein